MLSIVVITIASYVAVIPISSFWCSIGNPFNSKRTQQDDPLQDIVGQYVPNQTDNSIPHAEDVWVSSTTHWDR